MGSTRLIELDPPDGAKAGQKGLLAGLLGIDSELAEAVRVLNSTRNYQGWPTFLTDLQATRASIRVQSSLQQLREAGYDVTS